MCGFVVPYDQRSRHSIGEFRIALPVGLSGTLESAPEVVVQVGLPEVLLAISVESRANLKLNHGASNEPDNSASGASGHDW
jgi:hypothetical protein